MFLRSLLIIYLVPWRSGLHATVQTHVPNSQSSFAYRCDNVDQRLNQSFVLTPEKNHAETFGALAREKKGGKGRRNLC